MTGLKWTVEYLKKRLEREMERCEVIVLDEKPSELKFHKEKEVLSQISLWLPEHGWCATTLDVDY